LTILLDNWRFRPTTPWQEEDRNGDVPWCITASPAGRLNADNPDYAKFRGLGVSLAAFDQDQPVSAKRPRKGE
jgi:hypothetical protein